MGSHSGDTAGFTAFVSFLLLSIHQVLPSAPQLIRRLGPSLCMPSPIPCLAPFQAGDGGEGGGGEEEGKT